MGLSAIHFLLTYMCNFECDHCFLYCSPRSEGTFTLSKIKETLTQIKAVNSIKSVSFEGGEPFLMYPLLLEAVKLSNLQGLITTIETNTYWATTQEDAQIWLKPLHEAGPTVLDVSDDKFHHGDTLKNSAKNALNAAKNIGQKTSSICIERPSVSPDSDDKGNPIIAKIGFQRM
jgi:MoaA/NifB/PqqE/SkfB family radical SAM enzyme